MDDGYDEEWRGSESCVDRTELRLKKYPKKDEEGKEVVEPHEILDWKSQKLDWYGQQTSPQVGLLDSWLVAIFLKTIIIVPHVVHAIVFIYLFLR